MDGGKSRIPVLTYRDEHTNRKASTNSEKGKVLTKCFFPPKPPGLETLHRDIIDMGPCCEVDSITKEQIKRQL